MIHTDKRTQKEKIMPKKKKTKQLPAKTKKAPVEAPPKNLPELSEADRKEITKLKEAVNQHIVGELTDDGFTWNRYDGLGRDLLRLMKTTGLYSRKGGTYLLSQLINALPNPDTDSINAAYGMLAELAPSSATESMLCAQMVANHQLIMFQAMNAQRPELPMDIKDNYLNRLVKLQRLFNAQADTLHKLRNGGQQKMTVEHVHVNEGGQAIIGTVENKGGGA
ncbi:MAG: hypothetical protein KC475_09790 [Cyanobacteria bacterium HKST-UBA03]|nr:hypothetical protein [Cyanobacteria bacterium HKST-UBA03]